MQNNITGITLINKAIDNKDKHYREHLRILTDVVYNIGISQNPEFILSLEFPKAHEEDNMKLLEGVVNSEEARVINCINYLENVITKNIKKVSDEDIVKMWIFYKTYPKDETDLGRVIMKSCENCTVEDVNIPKVIRNSLGQYMKEE
jgi:hypothetical protein